MAYKRRYLCRNQIMFFLIETFNVSYPAHGTANGVWKMIGVIIVKGGLVYQEIRNLPDGPVLVWAALTWIEPASFRENLGDPFKTWACHECLNRYFM